MSRLVAIGFLVTALTLVVVVAADESSAPPTTQPTPTVSVEPTEEPFFGSTIDVSDFDAECEVVDAWLRHEAKQGDAEALEQNRHRVTPEHVEAKVRAWKPSDEGFAPTTATLLCITYTYEKKNDQAANSHNTWGKLCTRHLVVTNKGPVSAVDPAHVLIVEPRGGEHNDNLWLKTTAILEALATRADLADFDYYFFGGDDVMMLPTNLRKTISEPVTTLMHRSGTPLFFGTRFVFAPGDAVVLDLKDWKAIESLVGWGIQTEFLSGAGYVFNKHALHVVYHGLANQQIHCNPSMRSHAEDVYMAYCFQHYGIFPRDSRDAQGEDRVQVMTPYHMATQSANPAYTWWFRDYKPVPTPMGSEISSRHSWVWHYMGPADVAKMTKKYEGV